MLADGGVTMVASRLIRAQEAVQTCPAHSSGEEVIPAKNLIEPCRFRRGHCSFAAVSCSFSHSTIEVMAWWSSFVVARYRSECLDRRQHCAGVAQGHQQEVKTALERLAWRLASTY